MSVVRRKSDHQLFFVTNTRTKVTVLWQDGTEEQNVTSTDLVPVLHLLEQGEIKQNRIKFCFVACLFDFFNIFFALFRFFPW